MMRILFLALYLLGSLSFGAAERPILVVFDFESSFDEGRLGKKVAEIFRGHAFRRRGYITIHQMDMDALVAEANFHVSYNDPPGKLVSFAHTSFQANVVLWGKVEKLGRDRYKLYARAWDSRLDGGKMVLEFEKVCEGLHAIPVAVDAALDQLQGITRDEEADLMADTSWRNRDNLVKNPGFEEGDISPSHWEKVNGLTTFWVDKVSPTGKCVRIDTDVLEEQYRDWMARFEGGAPASAAPKKKPTKPPKYDTVGGTCGSHLYSDWIPIEQGVAYRSDNDVKGPKGNAKIFIKGYSLFQDAELGEQRREVYRAQIHLHMETDDERWEHFARIFHPTQPLILLGFSSAFDGHALGGRVRELLLAEAQKRRVLSMMNPERVRAAVEQHGFTPAFEAPEAEVHHFVATKIGNGVAVWGEVIQQEKGLKVLIRSMDVRPKTVTKAWRDSFECPTPERLPDTCRQIADRIFQKAYPVEWLKVKLDAYWPPGLYHFDNIYITAEPPKEAQP